LDFEGVALMSRTVAALIACSCFALAACENNKTTEGSATIDGAKACCAEKTECSEAKANCSESKASCSESAAKKECCSQKQ
jgi:hypothetical protein